MATTKKENKEPDELEIDEPETPPEKKAATTKKEDAPEWFQQLNNSIKELTTHLQPVKASQAGAVEIPIPGKPESEKKQGDDLETFHRSSSSRKNSRSSSGDVEVPEPDEPSETPPKKARSKKPSASKQQRKKSG